MKKISRSINIRFLIPFHTVSMGFITTPLIPDHHNRARAFSHRGRLNKTLLLQPKKGGFRKKRCGMKKNEPTNYANFCVSFTFYPCLPHPVAKPPRWSWSLRRLALSPPLSSSFNKWFSELSSASEVGGWKGVGRNAN